MIDDLSRRIDTLEIRFTEQEALIEDLNATITAQWRIIDAMKRDLARLTELVETVGETAAGAQEKPPPHY